MTYALELLVLIAGGVIMFALIPRGRESPQYRQPDRPGSRPADLERLEVLVTSIGLSAADAHATLRPLLREIAAVGLAGRGLRLARNPDAVRELLGDELWEIVRPGRPMPGDPHARGVTLEELIEMTDRLERL